MHLHWPQITYIVLSVIGLILHAGLNGRPMNSDWNFGLKLMSVLLSAGLLWAGGFFG